MPALLRNWFSKLDDITKYRAFNFNVKMAWIFVFPRKNEVVFHIQNLSCSSFFASYLASFCLEISCDTLLGQSKQWCWIFFHHFSLISSISCLVTNYFCETYQRDIVDICALTMIPPIYNTLCFLFRLCTYMRWQKCAATVNLGETRFKALSDFNNSLCAIAF